jgi:hypothetical protein
MHPAKQKGFCSRNLRLYAYKKKIAWSVIELRYLRDDTHLNMVYLFSIQNFLFNYSDLF